MRESEKERANATERECEKTCKKEELGDEEESDKEIKKNKIKKPKKQSKL